MFLVLLEEMITTYSLILTGFNVFLKKNYQKLEIFNNNTREFPVTRKSQTWYIKDVLQRN